MARSFRSTRKGIVARLDVEELDLLQVLIAQLVVLLGPDEMPAHDDAAWARELGLDDFVGQEDLFPQLPADTALARLLPDANRVDPLAAADFRRLTEGSIRQRKIEAARTTLGLLQKWRTARPQLVSRADARSVMTCLTDVRLVLADRLNIRTEADADTLHLRPLAEDDDHAESWLSGIYEFLGWLQESLVRQLFEGLDDSGDGRRTPPPGLDLRRPGQGTSE